MCECVHADAGRLIHRSVGEQPCRPGFIMQFSCVAKLLSEHKIGFKTSKMDLVTLMMIIVATSAEPKSSVIVF